MGQLALKRWTMEHQQRQWQTHSRNIFKWTHPYIHDHASTICMKLPKYLNMLNDVHIYLDRPTAIMATTLCSPPQKVRWSVTSDFHQFCWRIAVAWLQSIIISFEWWSKHLVNRSMKWFAWYLSLFQPYTTINFAMFFHSQNRTRARG